MLIWGSESCAEKENVPQGQMARRRERSEEKAIIFS